MKITRAEILKAIRVEPLKPGSWVHPIEKVINKETGETKEIYSKKCEVCAVGAVLRQKGVASRNIGKRAGGFLAWEAVSTDGDEKEALKEENYLLALSVKFEKLAERFGTGKRTRNKLAEFVKKNFPKVIRADL